MKKGTTLLLSILALAAFATSASASIKKGQKTYLKKCKKCHGNGTKGAAMKTQDEWSELFEEEAILLIEKHEGTKAEKFFGGKRFKKYAPHLKDFLHEYGSDSGNVPSCG
jgi:cytochrome c553